MDKVLINIGANIGQAINHWKDYVGEDFPNWQVLAYEPVEMPWKANYPNVTLNRQAVWTKNGTIPLHVDTNPRKLGTTMFNRDVSNISIETKDYPCVDLKDIMYLLHGSYIVIVINGEGVEYPLLEYMMTNGCLMMLNELWVAYHVNKGIISQEEHNRIEGKVRFESKFMDKYCILPDKVRGNMFKHSEVINAE